MNILRYLILFLLQETLCEFLNYKVLLLGELMLLAKYLMITWRSNANGIPPLAIDYKKKSMYGLTADLDGCFVPSVKKFHFNNKLYK